MSRYGETVQEADSGRTFFGLIAAGVAVVVFLIVALNTYYTIGQGERGVVLHYGAYSGVVQPGLGFKMPFVTGIERVSIQQFIINYGGDRGFGASSADQQVASIRVSVNMHVLANEKSVAEIYNVYAGLEGARQQLVDPKVMQSVKNVFGTYDAADAIQKRAKLVNEIEATIKAAVHGPIVVDSVQVENIAFSDEYNRAVEERMQAQVAAVKAEALKAQRITNADAAAYEVKTRADAMAHQIEVQGEAESKAIRLRGEALKENPGLPQLVAAERWNGVLPTTMLPGSSVPFVPVHPQQ